MSPRLPLALRITAAALFFAAAVAALADGAPSIRVIDGDTVALGRTTVRLVGLNAPDSGQIAVCPAEKALAAKATDRLRGLAGTPSAAVKLVPCSCKPGTEGTEACNFGRSCGILTVDGVDAATILISEGLAVPFKCGLTSCPPMPHPWCPK